MAQIDIGKLKPTWKSAYNNSTAYVVDDMVSYQNQSYICKLASTGNAPTNNTYWDLIAAKGSDGTDADLAAISGTVQGDLYYNNGSAIARLAPGTASQVLQTGGSGANPSWVDASAGITDADMWRLTADTAGGSNGTLTSNLERVDDATFAKLGTGMTVSSGHWVFPVTGLWHVMCNATIDSYDDRQSYLYTNVSTDGGSNYDTVAETTVGINTSTWSVVSAFNSSFVNVTNTSTFRVSFVTSSMAGNSLVRGETDYNKTSFKFIRLGDSV